MSPAELQPLSESSYTVYEGTTVPLGVRVIDEFNNPVRNEVVNIDVNPNTPSNSDGSKVSDNKGEIWYYFNAESSGSYTITFSIPSDSLSYSVNVNSPPTGGSGCIFNAYWMEGDSLTWNVSQEGASKTLNFKVIYGSDPVYNAQVYFAIDNTSVVSASKYDGRTDPSGIAQITLNAIANGDVSVIGTVASCTDVINLTVEGVSGANQPPVANFTYSPSYPEEGDTVTFDASASYDPDGSIVSYNWNFGDGSIGSGQTVQHVYSQAGTYTVTLNVTDDSGLTTSIQKTVSVGGLVYNNDAVAVDGDDSPNPDRKGGVIFTVTNKYSTTVEIYSITIDPPDNIDYLDDQLTPNNQPGRTEIYIEADTSSYVDFHGGVYIPNNGLTVDLDIDGDERSGTNAELNSGSKATFYLYEFFNKNGKNVNMANKQIVITIYYIVNGENKVKTFTITPS
ncbi:MAG: PKD domain-containing protein [Archaeoglobus sp.]|nr:PKD domain-containing protein [Archaeoglobus sp.]